MDCCAGAIAEIHFAGRLPILIAAVLVVIGTALHGVEILRIWQHLIDRPGAALAFRFLMQPTVSSILAIRDGIKDARKGRSPSFWTMLFDPEKRRPLLREGLVATSKIMLVAFVIDLVYQAIEWVVLCARPTEYERPP
jgi:hypothetical protein